MSLEDLLIDPAGKTKPVLDFHTNTIRNIDTERFRAEIVEGVPVILPKKPDTKLRKTDFHSQLNSSFDYAEHYRTDAEEFDYFAPKFGKLAETEMKRLHQKILSRIPAGSKIVLDAGCGGGWLSRAWVNHERSVISMDISLKNPRRAYQRFKHKNHYPLTADVYHLPIADNSLDAVIASEIMEHVAEPALFIKQLLRPLKKGGKLIITTPYNEKIKYHLCVHCNRPTPANAHLHSFNEQNIDKLKPENISEFTFSKFSDKYLNKLRFNLITSFMPFGFWNFADRIALKLLNAPARLMLEIRK